VRALAALLVLAVVCLTASSAVLLGAPERRAIDAGGAARALERFVESTAPSADVDVGALYGGRLELVDPRAALPAWHKHRRDDAVRVAAAARSCPPPALDAPLDDASLAKAYAWQALTCATGPGAEVEALLAAPPFMHPSGRSYVALGLARAADPAAFLRAHARGVHVTEIGSLDAAAFSPAERALGGLPEATWEALTRGDAIAISRASLVVAEHGPFGLARVRLYPRRAWDAAARAAGVRLTARASDGACDHAATPDLCWEPAADDAGRRGVLAAITVASAGATALSILALALGYARERRRMHLDRIHVLRTLTHEIRTPAASLALDIEPLRAAYDELPAACQEPVLRLSDGVARLGRALHASARFMALFEPGARDAVVTPQEIPSAEALFDELAGSWPEGAALVSGAIDGPLRLDAAWLEVAVKNLVENAARHGRPPIAVAWSLDRGALVVRVTDGGSTPHLSLRAASEPFRRGVESAGLGFGLAIVKRVAEILGGRLSHEPAPTTFELRVRARTP
jgi:signal transduction histidine kinase